MKNRNKVKEWLTVPEEQSPSTFYDQLISEGWLVLGRREQPVFEEREGKPQWLRQEIQFQVKKKDI